MHHTSYSPRCDRIDYVSQVLHESLIGGDGQRKKVTEDNGLDVLANKVRRWFPCNHVNAVVHTGEQLSDWDDPQA